VTLSETSTTT